MRNQVHTRLAHSRGCRVQVLLAIPRVYGFTFSQPIPYNHEFEKDVTSFSSHVLLCFIQHWQNYTARRMIHGRQAGNKYSLSLKPHQLL